MLRDTLVETQLKLTKKGIYLDTFLVSSRIIPSTIW